jgi:hypothetical protein
MTLRFRADADHCCVPSDARAGSAPGGLRVGRAAWLLGLTVRQYPDLEAGRNEFPSSEVHERIDKDADLLRTGAGEEVGGAGLRIGAIGCWWGVAWASKPERALPSSYQSRVIPCAPLTRFACVRLRKSLGSAAPGNDALRELPRSTNGSATCLAGRRRS